MTNLTGPGRAAGPLKSQTVVTDGDWHHVGYVWDGSRRYLYVDGVEVAADAKAVASPPSAAGAMYIGAGSELASDTFWSGRIDEVCIYSQAVQP